MNKIVLSIIIVISICSCSTEYSMNRCQDAKDMFTCSIQKGLGCSIQVSQPTFALGMEYELIGFSGGEFINNGLFKDEFFMTEEGVSDGGILIYCTKSGKYKPYDYRSKSYNGDFLLGMPFNLSHTSYIPSSYYSNVDASVSIGIGLRVGFNFGEFVDFIGGFFGSDIYDDDIYDEESGGERRKEYPYIPRSSKPLTK